MTRRLAYRTPLRCFLVAARTLTDPAALVLPRLRARWRHPQPTGGSPRSQSLLTQLQEPGSRPPVRGRAAHPGGPPRSIEGVPGEIAAPERILDRSSRRKMMPSAARMGNSLLPLQRQRRRVTQLGLGLLDAQALRTQHEERLTQQAISSLLTDPGGPGGRFETTSVPHRGQEPKPGSRIQSHVHRRTALAEGVAAIDRTWGGLTGCRSCQGLGWAQGSATPRCGGVG